MSEPQMILYVDSQFISPYAMSAFVALTEKKIPFVLRTVDLASRENRAPHYAGQSLTQRVPMLVHADLRLSESSAIAEYLEESFPAPLHTALYPSALRQRARAREIQSWLRSDLLPLRQERPTEVVFYAESKPAFSALAQHAAEKLIQACDALLEDDREHLFNTWCIADTDLALMLNRLLRNGDRLPDKLAHYAQRQWQRPVIQQWLQLVQQARQANQSSTE